ncbi:hypothetical protein DFH27DRAFT_90504 [Peziza echinospora]|nr:hypothetical protein DFH27DRAFT_90504 [Peziza echinospora]
MTEKRSVWREEEGGYVDEEEFIFLGDAMRRVGTGVGKMGEVISVLGRENKVLDQYVLLPWQMILSILETEGDKRELIGVSITSIVEIIQMITECTIYERLYLGRSPRLVGHWRIEKVIVKLYGRVLTFLEQVGRMNKDRDGACKEVRELRKGCDKAMRKLREKIKLLVPQDEIQDDIDASLKSILRDLHNPIGRNNIKDSELCDDLDVESQTEILQWISKTDYQNHHIHAMKDLLPHTGTWLNDAPEFKEWRVASGSRILWLHGIPGAGKTKLACNTIQKLRGKNEHVGFFYCNKNESLRRDKTTILQTLLEQLSAPITEVQDDDQPTGLKKQRKVFKSIDNLYTIHRKIQRTASLNFAECRDLLTSIAGMYEQVTIIIDALDEAEFESRGHLLDALAEIMKDSQGIVKIFISSRDDQDIKQSLKGVPNYYIKPKDNQDDIKRFIERELERAEGKEKGNGGWCVALDQALKEVVLDGLLRKADGMFQWVTLQLEYLKNLTTVEAIQEELLAIKAPKDLTAAYEKLLDSILSSSDSTTAIIALRWILCTEIPLRTEEWVAATTHTLCTHDDATEPPEIQLSHILNLCRNLVVEDTEGKVVRFSHLSVREHLEEYRSELFAPSLCHSMAAESCLRLILYDYKLESFHTTFLAFHDYATVYWSYHAVKCDSVYKHSEIEILLQEILGQSAKSLEAYQLWFKSVRDRFRRHRHSSWWDRGLGFDLLYHGSLISSPPNSLFLIANLGLGEQFPLLLNWNLKDINCNNENKETYLFLASREGHLATVKSLLKSGANVNAGRTCGFFWHPYHKFPNPLFAAIAKGRREVMEILLDHNADICHNASNYGWMEIKDLVQVAAKIGNAEIFRVVIDRLNPVSLSKTVVELVVSRFGMPLVEYVIGIYPEMVISQSVVDAATRNSNGDVLRLCLDRARTVQPTTKLTDESILAALAVECYQDDKQAKTAIKNVLDQWIGGGDVTEEMLSLAARNTAYGPMFLAQLFDRSPDLVATEALILDIVCKHIGLQLSLYDSKSCPGESMLCLLQRMPEITDAVFFAILHTDHVKDAAIWELLLKNPPTISHEILLAAASNKDIDPRFMQRLLEANPAVTEDVLVAALKHQEIIDNFALLLEKNPVITEALVVASLKKGCSL